MPRTFLKLAILLLTFSSIPSQFCYTLNEITFNEQERKDITIEKSNSNETIIFHSDTPDRAFKHYLKSEGESETLPCTSTQEEIVTGNGFSEIIELSIDGKYLAESHGYNLNRYTFIDDQLGIFSIEGHLDGNRTTNYSYHKKILGNSQINPSSEKGVFIMQNPNLLIGFDNENWRAEIRFLNRGEQWNAVLESPFNKSLTGRVYWIGLQEKILILATDMNQLLFYVLEKGPGTAVKGETNAIANFLKWEDFSEIFLDKAKVKISKNIRMKLYGEHLYVLDEGYGLLIFLVDQISEMNGTQWSDIYLKFQGGQEIIFLNETLAVIGNNDFREIYVNFLSKFAEETYYHQFGKQTFQKILPEEEFIFFFLSDSSMFYYRHSVPQKFLPDNSVKPITVDSNMIFNCSEPKNILFLSKLSRERFLFSNLWRANSSNSNLTAEHLELVFKPPMTECNRSLIFKNDIKKVYIQSYTKNCAERENDFSYRGVCIGFQDINLEFINKSIDTGPNTTNSTIAIDTNMTINKEMGFKQDLNIYLLIAVFILSILLLIAIAALILVSRKAKQYSTIDTSKSN